MLLMYCKSLVTLSYSYCIARHEIMNNVVIGMCALKEYLSTAIFHFGGMLENFTFSELQIIFFTRVST